ncbi:unnamed protein product [Closterium sp. NIES-53]
MAEGLWRGPSADQDVRFSDKDTKLLKTQRFAKIFDKPVDMKKVKKEVIYPWIARRVTELLGVEDEVLINFIFSLLQDEVDPKRMQIQLTGFLENHTTTFMKELWRILRNAHRNEHGIPQKLLDEFAEENGLIPTEVGDARKKALEAAARLSSDILEDAQKERGPKEDHEVPTIDGDADLQRCNRRNNFHAHDESWRSKRSLNTQQPQSPPPGFECRREWRSQIQPRSFKRHSSPQFSRKSQPEARLGFEGPCDEAKHAGQPQSTETTAVATPVTAQVESYQCAAAAHPAGSSQDFGGATSQVDVDGGRFVGAISQAGCNASHGQDKFYGSPDQQDSSHQVEDMDISSEDESCVKKGVTDSAGSAGEWEGMETRDERKARKKERRRHKEEKRARKEERRKRREEKRQRKAEKQAARETSKKAERGGDHPDDWESLPMIEPEAMKQDAEIQICSQEFEERDRRWLDTVLLDGPADISQPEDPDWGSMPKLAAAGKAVIESQERHKSITADEQRKANLERDLRMKVMHSFQAKRLTV